MQRHPNRGTGVDLTEIPVESRARFQELFETYFMEFQAEGEIEFGFIEEMAAKWRIRRIWAWRRPFSTCRRTARRRNSSRSSPPSTQVYGSPSSSMPPSRKPTKSVPLAAAFPVAEVPMIWSRLKSLYSRAFCHESYSWDPSRTALATPVGMAPTLVYL